MNIQNKIFAALLLSSAVIATPVFAGTGSAYGTAEHCSAALASGNYKEYTPKMVQTSQRVLLTNMRSAGLTGPTCIEERVRVSEIDGARANDKRTVWAYVIVPGEVIMFDGSRYMDLRCGNDGRNPVVRRQTAQRTEDKPCTDCDRQAAAPRPRLRRVSYAPAPQQQNDPQFYLPQQSIGLPASSNAVSLGGGHVTYLNTGGAQTAPVFTGATQPANPSGNDFTGATQPANSPGGVNPPIFGVNSVNTSGSGGIQAPNFGYGNGNNAPYSNVGSFGGNTNGSFNGAQVFNQNGGENTGGYVGGVQAPNLGGNTNTNTNTTTNSSNSSFGGTTGGTGN